MKTAWMTLVQQTRKMNPKLSLKDAMVLAKKSYKGKGVTKTSTRKKTAKKTNGKSKRKTMRKTRRNK